VNRPARLSAIRAAAAGSRALRGDGQKTRVVARDLFDAAARHRTELVHTPFYGVRCVTLQTSAPTRSIHANCGRARKLGSRRHTPPLTANVKRNFQFQLRAVLVGMGGTGGTGGTTRGISCLKGNRQGEQGGTGPILRTISVPPVPLRGSTLIRHFSFEYPLFPPELEASPQPTAAQLLLG
jgi:hypothetical protein